MKTSSRNHQLARHDTDLERIRPLPRRRRESLPLICRPGLGPLPLPSTSSASLADVTAGPTAL
jgi:hypothetical protein